MVKVALSVCFCGPTILLKILNFFFMFLDLFDVLVSKINFLKKKKHYFDAFPSKKHFEQQHLPQSQTLARVGTTN